MRAVGVQIVSANNNTPKSLSPHGIQPEVEVVVTLDCQRSAGDSEEAKKNANSGALGIFRGSANLIPVLCGERFWFPRRGIGRLRSRVPRARHRVRTPYGPGSGGLLRYARNKGENQEECASGRGGGNFSPPPPRRLDFRKRRAGIRSSAEPIAALPRGRAFRLTPLRVPHVQRVAGRYVRILDRT